MVTGMREMKDSGIDWVGKIPKDWRVLRNKYNFDLSKNIVGAKWAETQLLSLTKNGVKAITPEEQSGKVPTSFATYQLVGKNDIVMCLFDLDVSAVFSGISCLDGMISPAYKCFKCKSHLLPGYADYYFRTVFVDRKYKRYSKNVRYSLGTDDFFALPMIVPCISDQYRIVAFLDAKCAEIDALSADIQSEIETLEAYKRSVITEAVTKGLDKNAPMKDSGIEWVGEIPTTWDVKKGKYCLRYVQKPTKPDDDVITCFRDGEVTLRKNRREEGFTISLKEIGYQGIDVGDLIVHGMDGFAGAIGISDSRGKASPVLNVLDTDNNKRYIMYYLRSLAFNGVFLALSTGIRVRTCDTNWGKLRELLYVLPPKEEQDDIVRFIDDRLNATDEIIAQKQEQLVVLAEYKKSLIFEYVTGKKEVPA